MRIVYGSDSCTLLLFDKTEPASLVHAVTSRFRLGQLPFHLTRCGDDAVVPLSSELPAGLTLSLHVDGGRLGKSDLTSSEVSRETKVPDDMVLSFDPVLKTKSFLEHEDAHGSTKEVALRSIPSLGSGDALRSTGCIPLLQDRGPAGDSRLSSPGAARSSESLHDDLYHCHRHHDSTVSEAADAMNDVVKTVDRMSRLSSELANERTLLAWVRTGLAAMRTVFSFFGVAALSAGWLDSVIFAQGAMMTVVLVGSATGTLRYHRVRKALKMADPPEDFGRNSIMWFNSIVIITSVAVAAGIYTQQWDKS